MCSPFLVPRLSSFAAGSCGENDTAYEREFPLVSVYDLKETRLLDLPFDVRCGGAL